MDWHQIVDVVKPYLFKIETPEGFGTGFLFSYAANAKVCGVATAAHVIEHAVAWEQPIRMTHFESGKSRVLRKAAAAGPSSDDLLSIRIEFVNTKLDTAALVFLVGDMELPDQLLPLIDPERHLKVGVELGWLGFPALSPEDLCFFGGRVSRWAEDRDAYLVDGIAINGVSGGPAFYHDKKAQAVKIIGVISAYILNRPRGESLPGLLLVRDVTHLHDFASKVKKLENAKPKGPNAGKQS